MGRVENRIALVTGAARGLGAATAAKLAREGARVVVSDIDHAGAEQQVAFLNGELPGCATALPHDVADEASWRQALDTIEAELGALHILVNNAGVATVANVEEESLDNWRRVHAIDLDSVFLGCKLAIPLIAASGGGSIVNISSISGIIAGHNLAAYNSAKAAVMHLSKSVALHCARAGNNIRCNSVCPAFIDTALLDDMAPSDDRDAMLTKLGRQLPLGRIGRPEDVASAVLYLASDESSFVTGSELKVDGGISAM